MSDVMYTSVKAGHIVDKESFPTLSDGTAGGIEEDAVRIKLITPYILNFYIKKLELPVHFNDLLR